MTPLNWEDIARRLEGTPPTTFEPLKTGPTFLESLEGAAKTLRQQMAEKRAAEMKERELASDIRYQRAKGTAEILQEVMKLGGAPARIAYQQAMGEPAPAGLEFPEVQPKQEHITRSGTFTDPTTGQNLQVYTRVAVNPATGESVIRHYNASGQDVSDTVAANPQNYKVDQMFASAMTDADRDAARDAALMRQISSDVVRKVPKYAVDDMGNSRVVGYADAFDAKQWQVYNTMNLSPTVRDYLNALARQHSPELLQGGGAVKPHKPTTKRKPRIVIQSVEPVK